MNENEKKIEELKTKLKMREEALQMAYFSDGYDSNLIRRISEAIEDLKEQIEELEEADE